MSASARDNQYQPSLSRQYAALTGAAIVLIVLNHAIHFGLQVSPADGAWLKGLVVLQALGVFAVPTFLFVSGAFLAYAARDLSLKFLRSTLERIVWPYVVWSMAFYGLSALAGDEQFTLSAYLKNVLIGYPYHFVPLLILWYLTAPVAVRVGERYGALALAAIASYQVFLLASRVPGVLGTLGPPPQWTAFLKPPVISTSMSDWALYCPLGLVLTQHAAALRRHLFRARWMSVTAVAGLFALGILNAFAVLSAPWARFVAPVPLMFVLPLINRGSIPFVRTFEALGRRSYGIYLAHMVVMALAMSLATGRDLGAAALPGVTIPALFAGALVLSLLLMDMMTRSAPTRRLYRYCFGIAPAPGVFGSLAGAAPARQPTHARGSTGGTALGVSGPARGL